MISLANHDIHRLRQRVSRRAGLGHARSRHATARLCGGRVELKASVRAGVEHVGELVASDEADHSTGVFGHVVHHLWRGGA